MDGLHVRPLHSRNSLSFGTPHKPNFADSAGKDILFEISRGSSIFSRSVNFVEWNPLLSNSEGHMATKKTAVTNKSAKKSVEGKQTVGKDKAAKPASKRSISLPKEGKDPKGGLTAEGRKIYNEATGGHLRPGVKGVADTPEKKMRKGSFLTRHFTTPPGPVVKNGKPTRQALQAAAWGEPVPKTEAEEKKLAAKGRKLLAEAKRG